MDCDFCDDYGVCSHTPCPYHPLKTDWVKELDDALKEGNGFWGDIGYDEEVSRLASRSEEDIHRDEVKMTEAERARLDNLKNYILEKTRRQHCIVVNGAYVLKHKMPRNCENYNLADTTLPDGSIYRGGCWAHEQAICPFMHPGEEKKYTFNKGTKIFLLPTSSPSPTPSSPGLTPRSFSPANLFRPRTASTASGSWSPRLMTPCKEMTL